MGEGEELQGGQSHLEERSLVQRAAKGPPKGTSAGQSPPLPVPSLHPFGPSMPRPSACPV